MIDHIEQELNKKISVIAAFIDMKKCFDTVSKKKLKEKLAAGGLTWSFWNLLETYLRNRPQKMIINKIGTESDCAEYGIPQGSVTPHILYIIYTSNMMELSLNGNIFMCDDVTCVIRENKRKNRRNGR